MNIPSMHTFKPTLVLLIATVLAGCTAFRTPYERAPLATPTAWRNNIAADANAITIKSTDRWWKNFDDPQLNQLIDQVLARNNGLAGADILVRIAKLQAGLTAINPIVSASFGTTNSRNLRGAPDSTRSQSLTGSASYLVDFWGNLASQRDAAEWLALATVQDRESIALTLIGATASLYWQIANAHQHIEASEQSIAYTKKTLELVRVQYAVGSVSTLELLQAEQSLTLQQANHTQLLQQLVTSRAALALLFDGPPEAPFPERQSLSVVTLPDVDAGLPAELLGRRPDLRAGELRLRNMLANNDAVRTSFYPAFTLTGSLGSGSSSLVNVLKNPMGTLSTGLTFPFLQFDQMALSNKVSQATYEKGVIDFRQTFYKALSDVEVALSARRQFLLQGVKLKESLDAANKIERLYRQRYLAGAVSLRIWLDAQEAQRSAMVAVADSNLNLLNSQVNLYLALGGDGGGLVGN
ncbi:efflux transporter outer membrane subunit [Glaciimonas sp. PCH181]|uniref:efflux transporter outer membrane subunit n=1 Tax=Glaciimonas sp. PCH181 TaxID=2133943 RepID=UPI000D3D685B|nr:efflux transporter outer membrane subunit [Glaciimonas sp. PCH181]PUA18571.1 RND transporter [Glaciimonas sp. PCH181]